MRTKVFLCAVLISVAVFALSVESYAQSTTAASSAKVTKLLDDTGYTFTRKTDNVWYAVINRKTLKNFKLIVTTQDDLMVAFVTVAPKARIKKTPEFIETLLKFNNSLDFVKVGLDRDGDIFVRTDASVRTLDAQQLKEIIDQVAASANEVYEGVDVFLTD